ncbi:MAG: hypothetical protein ACLTMD_04970 [Clostridium sp.]
MAKGQTIDGKCISWGGWPYGDGTGDSDADQDGALLWPGLADYK